MTLGTTRADREKEASAKTGAFFFVLLKTYAQCGMRGVKGQCAS
jgi:hypothetical protein